MSRAHDVVVVGGGVIGLAIAWRAAAAGSSVALVDDARRERASWAAAGMLAPATEVHHGEEALLELGLRSAARYPGFVAELEAAAGMAVGYRPCGTLVVAADGDDHAVLEDLFDHQRRLGLDVTRLRARQCRELEPGLGTGVRGGILAAGDHQVDNRRLEEALRRAARRAQAELVTQRVASLELRGDRVDGVRLGDGTRLVARTVVLAAGCWSGCVGGLPDDVVPPVRPLKGQILRLRTDARARLLDRCVRGLVRGAPVYLVPRADGELVVGATVEEQGFDTTVTAGAVHELLRAARALVPAVDEAALGECWAGLRPASPDNAPLLGPSPLDGLVIATGHGRNGILLAPATADGVAGLLASGRVADHLVAFRPDRSRSVLPPGAPARPAPPATRQASPASPEAVPTW